MTISTRQIQPKSEIHSFRRRNHVLVALVGIVLTVSVMSGRTVHADGEPAEAFIKQLRSAGYFDMAIEYLDRMEKRSGIDPDFVAAIPLERAQTHIEEALSARNAKLRDEAFANAEVALRSFLKGGEHPRRSEAQLQLGKLQMIRAAQRLVGDPDNSDRKQANELYLAATKTFDAIVADLKTKLEAMKGQKIDASDSEAVARRDQYRFHYLQSQLNAADAMKLAAQALSDPAKDGKKLIDDAIARFTELNKKYSGYPAGAIALSHLGELNEILGNNDEALDHFLRMLETPDVDELRDAKLRAATGLIRLKLASDPPKYQDAIDRTAGWVKDIRPNEAALPAVQEFRLQLAKAYLAKAANKELKKGEIGRAKSEGRGLLREASKVAGPHVEEAKTLLAELGIEEEPAPLPTAEPPKSFDDAMEKANQILSLASNMEDAIKLLEEQKQTNDLKKQIGDMQKQIAESYSIGIQVLRAGLVMATSETGIESINQARQILAYFLYQTKRHRETIVVGEFLARQSPGSDLGLKGGLMALTSLQSLLVEVPDDANGGLLRQLESLGKYLARTWPNDPNAAAAQGLQIRLLLKKDDFDGARQLIEQMPQGAERAAFKRLLGKLEWNKSIGLRTSDPETSAAIVDQAIVSLREGLDEIPGNLVDLDGAKTALVLAKALLLKKDSRNAMIVLDHPKYGPVNLVEKLGKQGQDLTGELYSTVLKALVGQMLASDDPQQYLNRMIDTMANLRKAYDRPDAQEALANKYMLLAQDLKEQLDTASPQRKTKLITVFSEMLKRIADSTKDQATLRWVGQTLASMGESLIPEGQDKATGLAADLLNQSIDSFSALDDQKNATTLYLLGRSQRLVGKYQAAINTLHSLLKDKPLMLEAQVEAAQVYESWASTFAPNTAYKSYRAALEGTRPDKNKKNVIWGWAEISKRTSQGMNQNPAFKEKFFESRYHVALCLYLMGKITKKDTDLKKAIKVIREAATFFPNLGGPKQHAKYDALMREAQRAVGQNPIGI